MFKVTIGRYSHEFKSILAATQYLAAGGLDHATGTDGTRSATWNGECWTWDGCEHIQFMVDYMKAIGIKAVNHYPHAGGGPSFHCGACSAKADVPEELCE